MRSEEFGKLISDVDNLKGDVEVLNKAVMRGNGEPALTVTVPQLSKSVKELTPVVGDLKTGVNAFLQFQKEQEGYHRGKEASARKSQRLSNKNRWAIGLLVSAVVVLLVTLFTILSNRPEISI